MPQGANLTGYGVGPSGQILAGTPSPLQISTADLKPVATTKVDTSLNLDSRVDPPTNYPFNANDPTTYNKQTPVDVYDSLGNAHVMSMYYVKTGAGTWDVYAGSDGTELTNVNVARPGRRTPVDRRARRLAAATKAVPPVHRHRGQAEGLRRQASAAVVAAATAAGASAATRPRSRPPPPAPAAGGRLHPGPDRQGHRRGRVRAGVPVGHLNFDTNGALSATLMSPQTLPLTVNLPIYPADRRQGHPVDQAELHRHHPVRRRHQREEDHPGRLHRRPPAALLGRRRRHHPGPVQQRPDQAAGPGRARQLHQPGRPRAAGQQRLRRTSESGTRWSAPRTPAAWACCSRRPRKPRTST
jgi:flagellar hook protein FlgE